MILFGVVAGVVIQMFFMVFRRIGSHFLINFRRFVGEVRWDSREFAGVRNDTRGFARIRKGSLRFAGIRQDSLGFARILWDSRIRGSL